MLQKNKLLVVIILQKQAKHTTKKKYFSKYICNVTNFNYLEMKPKDLKSIVFIYNLFIRET